MRRTFAAASTALLAAALVVGAAVPASAATVTVVYDGVINEANPSDSYFVQLLAGDSVDIAMTCPDGTLDPYVVVYLGADDVASFDDEGEIPCGGYNDAIGTFVADEAGLYEFVATYAATTAGAYQLTLTYPTLAFTSPSAATVSAGSALSLPLMTDATVPATYLVTGGALPAGVTLTDGVLSGTPTVAGTYVVEITASGDGRTAVQSITITVLPALASTGVDAAVLSLSAVGLLAAGGILLYTRRRYAV